MRMLIVGVVNSPEEAMEIQFITRLFVVGNRMRELAKKIKE